MKPYFTCELNYRPNPHLMQVYAGFYALYKKGIIDLKVNFIKGNSDTWPVTTALINNQYKVIYDCLDGGGFANNIPEHDFTNYNNCHPKFYFKRSYNSQLTEGWPQGYLLHPLGLNYNVQPEQNLFTFNNNARQKLEYFLKTNSLASRLFRKRFYYTKDFEHYPIKPAEQKLLFLTRLWNPEDAKSSRSKIFRKQLNEMRIECIEACRKEFGNLFTGGVYRESYAEKNYPALVMPDHLTNKEHYLRAIKEHAVCITTTGLQSSTGWKLAEYVAASRAIVTEPLKFQVTGNFAAGENYLEFTSANELLQQTEILLNNSALMSKMMLNNYHYYNNYLKPENLILNTLLTINSDVEKGQPQLSSVQMSL